MYLGFVLRFKRDSTGRLEGGFDWLIHRIWALLLHSPYLLDMNYNICHRNLFAQLPNWKPISLDKEAQPESHSLKHFPPQQPPQNKLLVIFPAVVVVSVFYKTGIMANSFPRCCCANSATRIINPI